MNFAFLNNKTVLHTLNVQILYLTTASDLSLAYFMTNVTDVTCPTKMATLPKLFSLFCRAA